MSVSVPDKGEYLVRDGKVIEVIEVELTDTTSDWWRYEVWTGPQGDDD